jgi:hypothetical protein
MSLHGCLCLGSHWGSFIVFWTSLQGCVPCSPRTQLHGQLILGRISGDGDVPLEGAAAASTALITFIFHPLQSLFWGWLIQSHLQPRMWWRIQRQHRWQTWSVRASSGQVLSPAAEPGTKHLGTRRIIHVCHLPKHGHMCIIGDTHLGIIVTKLRRIVNNLMF